MKISFILFSPILILIAFDIVSNPKNQIQMWMKYFFSLEKKNMHDILLNIRTVESKYVVRNISSVLKKEVEFKVVIPNPAM